MSPYDRDDDEDLFGELPYAAGEILPEPVEASLPATERPAEPTVTEQEPDPFDDEEPAPLSVVPADAPATRPALHKPTPPPPPAEPAPPVVETIQTAPPVVSEDEALAEPRTVRSAWRTPVARIDATDDRELHGGRLTGDRVSLGNPTTAETGPPLTGGKVIACASAKGGVGKTTLAVVVATQIAAKFPDRSIALVDCEPDFGMLAPALHVGLGSPTLGDALRGTPISRVGVQIDSAITVYAAPDRVEDLHGLLSHPDKLRSIIDEIRGLHDVVLIDLGGGLAGELNATLLRGVHALLLVSEPRLQTTRALLMAVDRLRDANLLRDRGLTIVLNQVVTDETASDYPSSQGRTESILNVMSRRGLIPLVVPRDRALADALDDGVWALADTTDETRDAIDAVTRSVLATIET